MKNGFEIKFAGFQEYDKMREKVICGDLDNAVSRLTSERPTRSWFKHPQTNLPVAPCYPQE